MGVFAISYADTWGRSQHDQADYQVGSDVRVTAPGGAGNVPSWALHAAFSAIDGVTEAMPVDRQSLRLPGSARQGELIGLDPAAAGADRPPPIRPSNGVRSDRCCSPSPTCARPRCW